MKRFGLLLVALSCLTAALAVARSSGPAASRTGVPAIAGIAAEGTCLSCHSGNAVNSGGSVTLLGLPPYFTGGRTYRLTVHLASTQNAGTPQWGFEMTAVDTATGLGAGTFAVVNATDTQIASGAGSYATRRYPEQTSAGSKFGVVSPVEWQVDWTAPVAGASRVRFYVVGLAADGDGTTSGDWMYQANAASTDSLTDAVPTTWGTIKHLYVR